jgi:ribA/ribD-fused uncharacterized protein
MSSQFIHNWFSNFIPYETPVNINNIHFKTPEHLFQSLKATDWEDVKKIADCETPGQSKRLGRKIKIRSDWEEIRNDCMLYVLRFKFNKNTKFGEQLMNTQEPIVEQNNWHDNYWGDCFCEKCKSVEGKNNLGKLLMKIREELINAK